MRHEPTQQDREYSEARGLNIHDGRHVREIQEINPAELAPQYRKAAKKAAEAERLKAESEKEILEISHAHTRIGNLINECRSRRMDIEALEADLDVCKVTNMESVFEWNENISYNDWRRNMELRIKDVLAKREAVKHLPKMIAKVRAHISALEAEIKTLSTTYGIEIVESNRN